MLLHDDMYVREDMCPIGKIFPPWFLSVLFYHYLFQEHNNLNRRTKDTRQLFCVDHINPHQRHTSALTILSGSTQKEARYHIPSQSFFS